MTPSLMPTGLDAQHMPVLSSMSVVIVIVNSCSALVSLVVCFVTVVLRFWYSSDKVEGPERQPNSVRSLIGSTHSDFRQNVHGLK